LEGDIDLTYRCNCNCRHCWVRLPVKDRAERQELPFDEIRRLAGEARQLGCRRWSISGGEPMLRPDFPEIFELLTDHCLPYTINTNGTLITPAIARLLKRRGTKMVALYGATQAVHDRITRTPGSFTAVMQGFAYLREAKAGFIVQIIPLRDNLHEFDAMVRLALSLSPLYRVGAPWLYLSATHGPARNREIARQRLAPADVVRVDPPDMMEDDEATAETREGNGLGRQEPPQAEPLLFAACIDGGCDFHIDPYGSMSFCSFITEPGMRFDLRTGSYREAWETFLPSLVNRAKGGREYREHCGRCDRRPECRWCPAYGYLEQGRYTARVPYLCDIAVQTQRYKENWRRNHRRYFRIAGVTIRVDSDLPITDKTFAARFHPFQIAGPGEETIRLHHHFHLPEGTLAAAGQLVYRRPPWAIYNKDRSWIYLDAGPRANGESVYGAAVFNEEHTRGRIYHRDAEVFLQGDLHSLTMLPSDQILLARALADRQACYFHAAGVVIDGKGMLLVGHSGAGKTTAVRMLMKQGTLLCDDRIIVRRWPDRFRIHGTWSHGDLAEVSAADAPLAAILFLEKAAENSLVPLSRGMEAAGLLALHVVKSLATADWWKKILALLEGMAREIPCYRLRFDKSGRVIDTLGAVP
jgi:MoaA/NifB/PqqE/SkfB family radical SAM enzyme